MYVWPSKSTVLSFWPWIGTKFCVRLCRKLLFWKSKILFIIIFVTLPYGNTLLLIVILFFPCVWLGSGCPKLVSRILGHIFETVLTLVCNVCIQWYKLHSSIDVNMWMWYFTTWWFFFSWFNTNSSCILITTW